MFMSVNGDEGETRTFNKRQVLLSRFGSRTRFLEGMLSGGHAVEH